MELAEQVAELRAAERDKRAATHMMRAVEASIAERRKAWMDEWEELNREWLGAFADYADANMRCERLSSGLDAKFGLTL